MIKSNFERAIIALVFKCVGISKVRLIFKLKNEKMIKIMCACTCIFYLFSLIYSYNKTDAPKFSFYNLQLYFDKYKS